MVLDCTCRIKADSLINPRSKCICMLVGAPCEFECNVYCDGKMEDSMRDIDKSVKIIGELILRTKRVKNICTFLCFSFTEEQYQ